VWRRGAGRGCRKGEGTVLSEDDRISGELEDGDSMAGIKSMSKLQNIIVTPSLDDPGSLLIDQN
jgi:hypothetical protein